MTSLQLASLAGLAVLTLNVGLCLLRTIKGPTQFDRIMALEAITFNLSGAVVLVSIVQHTGVYMDFLLVAALLGFIGTLSLTAFVEKSLGS